MTRSQDTSRETAEALLALGVTREQAAFIPPSDEELAQLLDPQGSASLDATRKAQIMDAIANDPDAFSRWMGMVEIAETLQLGNFSPATSSAADQAEAQQRNASVIARLSNFVAEHVRSIFATGGAVGVAVALGVVFMLPVGMDSKVSGLYDRYGSSWSTQPQQLDLIRGGTDAPAAILTEADQRLKDGVEAGLALLGPDFQLRNLNRGSTTDTSNLDGELSDALYALGQVAAISHFKCYLGAEKAYYQASWDLIEEFKPVLKTSTDETSLALSKTLERRGSPETQVCRVSKQVVERVSK